ncbi:MAG: zinc ribbon domain-containing protein, partial [Terriglobales bacterium]
MDGTFFCNKCGAQNAAGAQFCNRCGAPTSPTSGISPTPVPAPAPAFPYATSPAGYPPMVGVGYGGFWIRVVAFIIDGILVRVVVSPIHLVFGGLGLAG